MMSFYFWKMFGVSIYCNSGCAIDHENKRRFFLPQAREIWTVLTQMPQCHLGTWNCLHTLDNFFSTIGSISRYVGEPDYLETTVILMQYYYYGALSTSFNSTHKLFLGKNQISVTSCGVHREAPVKAAVKTRTTKNTRENAPVIGH